MRVRKEITVALGNRPGSLGELTECLAAAKVNILGISVVESANMGLVRMVLDKPEKAMRLLCECCLLTVVATEVLEVSLPNRAGALGKLAARLGRRHVNVEYVYGTTTGKGKANVIVGVKDVKKAGRALK